MTYLAKLTSIILSFIFMTSFAYAGISKTRNFHSFDENLLTSGQPAQSILENAAEDGIEVVINLVPASESIYNPKEAETLEKQGIKYIHNPVNWSNPKPSELESFLAAMKQAEGKKVLVHCWANARASAFAYAYRASQNPETAGQEYEELKQIWKDVAGYNLEGNNTWQNFLKTNITKTQ